MPMDRHLIAPFETGLQQDLRPWLIMDDAFVSLQNAYIFRGRITKRFGSLLMGASQLQSRFRINLGNTDGAGNISGTVPGTVTIGTIGQQFSIGAEIFTVTVTGAPGVMLTTGAATVHTFNTTTGAYVINGAAAATALFWYPAFPVMGLTQYETGAINNQPSYGFDTQFGYTFTPGTGWARAGTGTLPIWHGSNSQYFWSTNWDGLTPDVVILYVANFNATIGLGLVTDDPIWSLNGNTWTPYSYSPDATLNPGNVQPLTVTTTITNGTIISGYIQEARIILPFKNRLIMLNTIENNANGADQWNSGVPATTGNTPARYLTSTNTQFKNRCRYSHNGSPFAKNAWLEPNLTYQSQVGGATVVADGAGFIDAPTEEGIVSAEFIKDRLIVYFERSTWELAYTGNESLPFVWQKINTELGSQGTFSTVPFDKQVLTIGNTGVHACSGANVERIDIKIPDQIFDFKVSSNENLRIAGIRDYYKELVYWAYVDSSDTSTLNFPNQILVYNYRNNSWALFDDCFTAFGYFEQQSDMTWASSAPLTWEESNFAWNSNVVAAQQRQILGGTPEGFVLRIEPDISRNAACMQITAMTIPSATVPGCVDVTAINHNVSPGDFVAIENAGGITYPQVIYQVFSTPTANTMILLDSIATPMTGVYTGGGTLARVSNIGILSKQWNPYAHIDRNIYLAKIDFGVQKTAAGEITVDYFPSSTSLSMIAAGDASGSIMGTSVLETHPYNPALYPLEQAQERLWHPVYFQTSGECIQIFMYFSYNQMINSSISWSDLEIQGLILYTQPLSARLE